ncbi:MAG: recombinase family protein [Pseudomonadota bacterium]
MGRSNEAFAIIRVSSTKQASGTSPEAQREGLLTYAARCGLNVVRVWVIHESGKDSELRVKFHEMLEVSTKQDVPHLLFWQMDRIARNLTDYEVVEKRVRSAQNVLHIAAESRVLHQASAESEWTVQDLGALTSKSYSRDQRRRARESMRHKADSGWYPGRPKFLYRNEKSVGPDGQVRDRGGTIVLTDWGRVLGRRMLELRLQGMSLASIAERAIEEELVPVQHQTRFRGRAARVEHILKSRFYLGEFEWADKTFAGKHEALFTSEEWTALQRTFNGVPAPLRADQCAAPLAGLMKCGECGCAITFERKVKKSGREFRYLRCANGKKAHPSLVYVSEEEVFNGFASAIASIAINTNLAEEIGAVLSESQNAVKATRKRDSARFQAELADLERREDLLYDDRARGLLDDDGYRRQLARLRTMRSDAAKKVEAANADLDDEWLFTAQRTLELAKSAAELWVSRSGAEKRMLLEMMVSNPTLTGRKVAYELKKPFAVLAEIRRKGVGRAP